MLHVGDRQAQRILKKIREEFNKKKNQAVTVKEFCEHRGLEEKDVLNILSVKRPLPEQKS
jgi:hypothetical protein